MKKFISIFIVLAFILFSFSCYITRIRELRKIPVMKRSEALILSVDKTTGEHIEFSKDNPGRVHKDMIVGIAIIRSKELVVKRADVKKIRTHSDGSIFEVIDKEGKIYHVVSIGIEEEDKIIFFTTYETSESVSIPFSEIKSAQAKIRSKNPSLTFLAYVGAFSLLASSIVLYIVLKSAVI